MVKAILFVRGYYFSIIYQHHSLHGLLEIVTQFLMEALSIGSSLAQKGHTYNDFALFLNGHNDMSVI